MLDLVGNPEDRFSHDAAQFSFDVIEDKHPPQEQVRTETQIKVQSSVIKSLFMLGPLHCSQVISFAT